MESEEQLLQELEAEGFETDQFKDKLREHIALGITPFRLNCKKQFGEELMIYTLVIDRDKDLGYRLTELTATHRDVIDIDDKVFKGISIDQLDKEMAEIDWPAYFHGTGKSRTPLEEAITGSIISRLIKLDGIKDADAILHQQLLMYKYWPNQVFELYRKSEIKDLASVHEHTYNFMASKGETLNANLAYFIISERLDSLMNYMESIGADKIADGYLQPQILKQLRENPYSFIIAGSSNTPECHAEFSILVSKPNGWYSVESYQASITPYPAIPHGTYNGVDTQELESKMKILSRKDKDGIFVYNTELDSIREYLHQLKQEETGRYIAGLLELKYMQGNEFYKGTIQQSVWNLLERLPKMQREFPAEIKLECGVNLLLGRTVLEDPGNLLTRERNNWMRLNLDDEKNGYPLNKISSFNLPMLENLVCRIAPGNTHASQIARDLSDGRFAELTVNKEQQILIEANPEKGILNLFTPDLKPIPFNINFDPDWKPANSLQENKGQNLKQIQSSRPKFRPNKNHKRNKGKGL